MGAALDLDAYFGRIRWGGTTEPSFDTLTGLLRAHTASIPFENLDVLLARPVRLDVESLQDKMVRAGRGGYCFEHATLFAAVLEALGFSPARHAGRVILFAAPTDAPRAHMFLTVEIGEQTFVTDPGFGAFTSSVPIPLDGTAASADVAGGHRMAREGKLWVLHVQRGGEQAPGWITTLERENPIDFEVANHWVATHPNSPFVKGMMLSAATPGGRVNVINRDVTLLQNGEATTWQLAGRSELRALLTRHFGFDLPQVDTIRIPAIAEWN